jgi:hypothetical protein
MQVAKYRESNYVITMSTVSGGKECANLRILVSPDQIDIENVLLLRSVIEGEQLTGWNYREVVVEEERVHGDLDLDELE